MATSNNDWLQIYQNNLAGPTHTTGMRWPGDVTDATTVTTTATTATSGVSNQLGRVTRPNNTRRRTRASRKTPTTLLNTDTTNFRAMVQQFTGGNFCGGAVGSTGGGGLTGYTAASAAVPPRQPLMSYNSNSSGFNYYGMGSGISSSSDIGSYSMEFRQPQHQHFYTVMADNGGAGGDQQHGFVQRI